MSKYKFISILVTITFLWQNLLGADVLRPRAVEQRRPWFVVDMRHPENLGLDRVTREVDIILTFLHNGLVLHDEQHNPNPEILEFLPEINSGLDGIELLLPRLMQFSSMPKGATRINDLGSIMTQVIDYVPNLEIKKRCFQILEKIGRASIFYLSGIHANSSDAEEIKMAAISLSTLGYEAADYLGRACFRGGSSNARRISAIKALGQMPAELSSRYLMRVLKESPFPQEKRLAVQGLIRQGTNRVMLRKLAASKRISSQVKRIISEELKKEEREDLITCHI